MDRRWASNNSVFGHVGMNYSEIVPLMADNGEPGIIWLQNMKEYGRMGRDPDYKDARALGSNPCFHGETLIAVADGRGAVPIKQLVEEGNDVPVYSMNPKGKVEIKWARNPRLTRQQTDLVEIVLDDGSSLKVTPNHKMILLDGTKVYAKDLQPGNSLPRFTKRAEVLSNRSKNKNRYLRVYCDTRSTRRNKIFEHRLIAQFHEPKTWDNLYDENKQNGWIKGGLVIHHKDYDPLNNAPDNLEIMTFRDHSSLHGSVDFKGENNPMWGRSHSDETKEKIGASTKERWQDPVIREKMSYVKSLYA